MELPGLARPPTTIAIDRGDRIAQAAAMEEWTSGYTPAQLERAQNRYDLRFPPDLIALLLDRRPAKGYHWDEEDPRIREMLAWPFNTILWDVEKGFWWPDWGDRPSHVNERREVVTGALANKSRLIPLLGHRFLPKSPTEAGNPVFSMYGFDTVCYGANLEEYFNNEFGQHRTLRPVRYISFWSDLVERHDLAYACYAASEEAPAFCLGPIGSE